MEWDIIVEVISDSVKDDETRTEIYKKFFEASGDIEYDDIESEIGIDDAFDNAWNLFEFENASDDTDEDDEDEDDDYEDGSEDEWDHDDGSED